MVTKMLGWVLTFTKRPMASSFASLPFVAPPRPVPMSTISLAPVRSSSSSRTFASAVSATAAAATTTTTSSTVTTTAATAAAAAAALLDVHDVHVETTQPASRGSGLYRLRVHVMPLEATHLDVLLAQVHARVSKEGGVLGMDAEWQPEMARFERNPVALLQLAWEEDVFLVRLQHLVGDVPASLHKLLSDESIVKVGCNVAGDAKRLMQDYALETRGHMDLREVTQGLGLVQCKKRSMAWLAKEFVGLEMDKSQQCSDWGNRELSPEQIKYSSIDAWVAGAIVGNLYRTYKHQVGQPPSVTSFCQRLVPQHKNRRGGGASPGGKRGGKKQQQQPQPQPPPQPVEEDLPGAATL